MKKIFIISLMLIAWFIVTLRHPDAVAQMSVMVIGGGQTSGGDEPTTLTVGFADGSLEYIQETTVYFVGGSLYIIHEQ